jgi:hypothetical protein
VVGKTPSHEHPPDDSEHNAYFIVRSTQPGARSKSRSVAVMKQIVQKLFVCECLGLDRLPCVPFLSLLKLEVRSFAQQRGILTS